MADPDYSALLADLQQLTDRQGGADFTRSNLIALLDLLNEHLGKALAVNLGELDDGTIITGEHPVATQLSGIAMALRDLDKGLKDQLFLPALAGKNASRHWSLEQQDKALAEMLIVFQHAHGIATLKKASARLAAKLKQRKYARRGKVLSGRDLYNLYYRYR